MTPRERLRLIWHLITANDAAVVAEGIRRVPTDELWKTGESIVRNTTAVLEGMQTMLAGTQAVQVGLLEELARQTELLNEITARLTIVELSQPQHLAELKCEIAAINERLARGDMKFDALDNKITARANGRPALESERGE